MPRCAGVAALPACLRARWAAKANLRQATISALESGGAGMQLRTLIDVMAALGLEIVIRERTKAASNIEDVF